MSSNGPGEGETPARKQKHHRPNSVLWSLGFSYRGGKHHNRVAYHTGTPLVIAMIFGERSAVLPTLSNPEKNVHLDSMCTRQMNSLVTI